MVKYDKILNRFPNPKILYFYIIGFPIVLILNILFPAGPCASGNSIYALGVTLLFIISSIILFFRSIIKIKFKGKEYGIELLLHITFWVVLISVWMILSLILP